MKTTPFTDIHIALGAKMADFAGFNMPIQYPTGINQEHIMNNHFFSIYKRSCVLKPFIKYNLVLI